MSSNGVPRANGMEGATQNETQKHATISELERLSSAGISAFNDHDFSFAGNSDRREFLSRIAPHFQARIENASEQGISFDELLQIWKGYAEAEPKCRFQIVNVFTDINVNGTATVFLELNVTGFLGVSLVRLMEMKWKIMSGKWIYYSCVTLGGSSADGGPRKF